jgi:alkylation response protein AidB-like acyl-CoA dehydrogenase
MALVLTEEQQMLRDAAAGFLAEKAVTRAAARPARRGDELGFDPSGGARWSRWAGRHRHPRGLRRPGLWLHGARRRARAGGSPPQPGAAAVSVLLGATLINLLGTKRRSTTGCGDRQRRAQVSLALQEGAQFAPGGRCPARRRDGDAFVLSGEKRLVLDAAGADAFIVVARSAGRRENDGPQRVPRARGQRRVSVQRCELVDSRAVRRPDLDVALGADAR